MNRRIRIHRILRSCARWIFTLAVLAPFAHGLDDGLETLPDRSEGVFDPRRDLGVDLAMNDAVALELAELPGEHFGGDAG